MPVKFLKTKVTKIILFVFFPFSDMLFDNIKCSQCNLIRIIRLYHPLPMLKSELSQLDISFKNLALFWVNISGFIILLAIRFNTALFFHRFLCNIFFFFFKTIDKVVLRQNLNSLRFRNSLFERKFYFNSVWDPGHRGLILY